MKMKNTFILLFTIIILSACSGASGDFEPNNLISIEDDEKAEADLAKTSGPPFIESLSLSAPKIHNTGDKIIIYATFSKRVRITNSATPRIGLDIGGVTRFAQYISGSESIDRVFQFEYTIQAGDLDGDGVGIMASLDLNGSNLVDYADQLALTPFSAPLLPNHLVDTSDLQVSLIGSQYTNNAAIDFSVTTLTGINLSIGHTCGSGGVLTPLASPYTHTIANLNATTTLFVAVENGSGGTSQCKSLSFTHDTLPPNLVTTTTLGNNSSDIVSDLTSWSFTSDNGPSGIELYEIAVSTTQDASGILPAANWQSVGPLNFGQIDNGEVPFLAPATNYYTLIRSRDFAGNYSGIASSLAWQIAALSPEQITSMSVVNSTDSSLRLGWPYPDDNGFPITDYVIQFKLASDTTWTTLSDGTSTSRRYTHTGLTPGTSYNYRVRAFNGTNFGAWSPILTAETLPAIEFVSTPYIAINVGGATHNQLVSFEDDNEIYYGDNSSSTFNDGSAISLDLDRGKVVSVPANDFTVVRATKPFYIAGRLGSGSNTRKANVTWQTSDWIGKQFLFSHSRSNPMRVKVYAFTDSTVSITRNGAAVTNGVATIDEEKGHTFTISSYGSYEITSTGFIVAYGYANGNGSEYVDPKPFLPSSNDLIGIPSRSAKVSSRTLNNSYELYHSDGVNQSRTANAGTTDTFNSRGVSSTYQDEAVRLRASEAIVANSYADANGNCSAPLVPSAFQKTRFALNVQAEWLAFASTNELTVTIYEPNTSGTGFLPPVTLNMNRVGSNNNTPTKAYQTRNYRAGTIIEGTQPFQAYYEPLNDTNAANDDETIMFGWD